ncbi:hypothetical protein PHAVU_002G263100 [Phaseolus vulgaris]|uniref:Uncharacterized protein n=1 Tax=Phaseolus vulgaris TaxID=3885 RepID=V7CS40_PHAVU|nr:hypothetical protein PHAVU_002G263100g [Phaseolus vulgaris]ESW31731.1 hypothetical protein PHAVU_002G263100g [Phaseolus vulgaris]
MSDIAILVAEEYERRVQCLKKSGGSGGGEIHLFSSVSGMLSRFKENKHLLQKVLEPKTQVAMAASDSFFSA